MKQKRILVIAVLIVTLALIAAFGLFRSTEGVRAQDQIPPPVPDRISCAVFTHPAMARGFKPQPDPPSEQ